MSSRRELITQNIVDTLKNQQTARFGTVTRDPGIQLQDLAQTAFPAVVIESGNEERTSITQGGLTQTRESFMDVNISVWTNSNSRVDTLRNDLIESIEELLDADPSRGGYALDTQLVSVVTNNNETAPYFAMGMTFQIRYLYTKGQV
jgi:3'-phosphoadenosine 5'-phosphosulfate sulfotransferase